MSKVNKYVLVFILVIASFLRIFQLSSLPISLVGDEIDVGYQAWSLGTTLKDYRGNFLPAMLHSLSEWRTPLLSYFLAPILRIVGPSVMAVRLPVAVMGVLNIYLIYVLFQKIAPADKKYGVIAAFFLAISPWHIFFSRAAFDSTLLLNLYLGAIILWLDAKFYLALPLFILTFYTYPIATIFTPLFIGLGWLTHKTKLFEKKYLWVHIFSFILVLPFVINLINGSAVDRISGINIMSDPKIADGVILARTEPWVVGNKAEVLFHNKLVSMVTTITTNYFQAFSSTFLFISGDPNFGHSTGVFGEFYIILAPLLVIGIYSVIKRLRDSKIRLLLFWLLLAPLPAALTQDGGTHAIRLILLLPAMILVMTLAWADIFAVIGKYWWHMLVVVGYFIGCGISILFFWHTYSNHYRFQSFKNWQYGYEQAFQLLDQHKVSGNIFINNSYEPSLIRYLYFRKIAPINFQKAFTSDTVVKNIAPGFDGFRVGEHLYFGTLSKGESTGSLLKPDDAYVAAQKIEIPGNQDWSKEPQEGLKTLGVVRNPYGDPLFTVVTKK